MKQLHKSQINYSAVTQIEQIIIISNLDSKSLKSDPDATIEYYLTCKLIVLFDTQRDLIKFLNCSILYID